jgi:hypothetical protein
VGFTINKTHKEHPKVRPLLVVSGSCATVGFKQKSSQFYVICRLIVFWMLGSGVEYMTNVLNQTHIIISRKPIGISDLSP